MAWSARGSGSGHTQEQSVTRALKGGSAKKKARASRRTATRRTTRETVCAKKNSVAGRRSGLCRRRGSLCCPRNRKTLHAVAESANQRSKCREFQDIFVVDNAEVTCKQDVPRQWCDESYSGSHAGSELKLRGFVTANLGEVVQGAPRIEWEQAPVVRSGCSR